MNSNVVSLEIAKLLKAAAFSQATWAAWYYDTSGGPSHRSPHEWRVSFEAPTYLISDWYGAPMAQELLDNLPPASAGSDRNVLTVGRNASGSGFWARFTESPDAAQVVEHGPTLADALAMLWLRLSRADLLPPSEDSRRD